jgi:hypothetical protein
MGARRLALMCAVAATVSLVCLSASTVALGAPEAPVTEAATSVGANSAALNGELNPGGLASNGWYFAYNTNGACLGGGTAGGEGVAGVEKEHVSTEATGLEPGTLYTYCLVSYNEVGESTPGATQSFTTSVSQPVIDGENASNVGSSAATLEAYVNPEKQATSCLRFEYGETTAYGHTTACYPSSLGDNFGDQTTAASLTGLKLDSTYHFRVVVENSSSPVGGTYGSDQTFTTLRLVESESFSEVKVRGVLLSATLNPKGPVTYRFEYGTTTAYGSNTPVEHLEAGEGPTAVNAKLETLEPGTEYHFRIDATNAKGESEYGNDMVFRMFPETVGVLPDHRIYELVTPAENDDANVYVPRVLKDDSMPGVLGTGTRFLFRSSASGNAVTYVSDPTSGGNGNSGLGEGNEYLARRLPGGGWEQINLQLFGNESAYYQAFSDDLSIGVLQAGSGQTETEAEANAGAGKRLSLDAPGEGHKILYVHAIGGGSYEPFVTTSTPLHRSGSELQSNGFSVKIAPAVNGRPLAYVGGSTDMSKLFFEANDALTETAEDGGPGKDNLYEFTDGGLSLVNVLPEGSTKANATFGSSGSPGPDLSHVISADGTRAFWTDLNTGDLYMSENIGEPNARTVQVDAAVGGGGRYATATGDGSRVFFIKGDLYEYEVGTGRTYDLTQGVEVQAVIGASEDGKYVYYVDNSNDLMLWHDGVNTRIAVLSTGDGEGSLPEAGGTSRFGDWLPDLGFRTAEVTPDGHSVVFVASESLKTQGFPNGYQNDGFQEVYDYESETDRLTCVSCNRTGEPPIQTFFTENEGLGSFVPPSVNDTFISQWISSDGSRVFFDSSQALVPSDTNGALDVYEWERDGAGTCREQEGCVYLLSGGVSGSQSFLAGESESGNDVFVVTRAQLAAQDGNETYDLYDMSADGSLPVAPSACTGTGCQGVPEPPPVFATPPSVTFSGVGNFPVPSIVKTVSRKRTASSAQRLKLALKTCRAKNGDRRRRVVCERRARRQYAQTKKRAAGKGKASSRMRGRA